MKRIVPVLVITVLLLVSAGCLDFLHPLKINQTVNKSTSFSGAKYSVGDVAIAQPDEDIGQVVQNYDPVSHKYSTRAIIFDEFGKLFFYEGGSKSFSTTEFEARYPYKRAHIENPYGLPSLKKEYSAKYKVDQVVTKKNVPLEGVKILSYDYETDAYTYVYAYKSGSTWTYDKTNYTAARTDLEGRFK